MKYAEVRRKRKDYQNRASLMPLFRDYYYNDIDTILYHDLIYCITKKLRKYSK